MTGRPSYGCGVHPANEERVVHVQIVTFQLEAMTDRDYREVCDRLAPAFAALPGLVSKTWLADEAGNTYGGVYTWRDRQAMEAFADTDLFKGFVADPHFTDIAAFDFAVLDGPTAVTHRQAALAA
jgi:quinol monooxygenase YgiN